MVESAYSEEIMEKMEMSSKQHKGLEGKSSVVEAKIEIMGENASSEINSAKAGVSMSTEK